VSSNSRRQRVALCALSLCVAAVTLTAEETPRRLPFLGEEARKRGIELPRPFGIGITYYKLNRDIDVTEVRVGRNGAAVQPVPDFAQFASTSDVDNVNVKFDVWLLPFLNLYAIAGGIKNTSHTTLDVTLPPITPGGPQRQFHTTVPTKLNGSVGGLGITLAGGYGPFFFAGDVNGAQADLGFDDRFRAVVSSIRAGWNGTAGTRPLRIWANATNWDTFATATGTVTDPDGGTLAFEVDQGPAYPHTYGFGASYSWRPSLDFSVDTGTDFHGGWYIALVPVFRF
jgi:hypothetical protein